MLGELQILLDELFVKVGEYNKQVHGIKKLGLFGVGGEAGFDQVVFLVTSNLTFLYVFRLMNPGQGAQPDVGRSSPFND